MNLRETAMERPESGLEGPVTMEVTVEIHQDHIYQKPVPVEVLNVLPIEDIAELGGVTKNCKYCRQPVMCSVKHMQDRHLKHAIHFESDGIEKFTIPCFCEMGLREKNRCHWHCPKCHHILSRADSFKRHLSQHGFEVTDREGRPQVVKQCIYPTERTPERNDEHISQTDKSSYEPEGERAGERPESDLDGSGPMQNDEDIDELVGKAADSMEVAAGIPEDHMYLKTDYKSGEKKVPVELLAVLPTEDIEELGGGTKNCKYCRQPVLCTAKHMKDRHLKHAIHFEYNGIEKFIISCFCAMGWREKNRCHWHCPTCQLTISRTDAFKLHLSQHGFKIMKIKKKHKEVRLLKHQGPAFDEEDLEKLVRQPADIMDTTAEFPDEVSSKENKAQSGGTMNCKYCSKPIRCTQKHMHFRHLNHAIHFEVSGIKKFTFPCFCKMGSLEKNRSHWHCPTCSLVLTRTVSFMRHLSTHGFKVSKQEQHKKGTGFKVRAQEYRNNGSGFKVMEHKHRKKASSCVKDKSSHEPEQERERERAEDTRWSDLEGPEPLSDEEDPDMLVRPTDPKDTAPEILSRKHIRQVTEYIWRAKRVPAELPHDLATKEREVPESFEPTETTCPYCPGPSPPALGERRLVTCHGMVYGLSAVTKAISVYVKVCRICSHPVRFQDYRSGFHNFNSKTIVTIPLCSLLTAGLGNHIAIGQLIQTLESHLSMGLPVDEIRRAFHHFNALRQHEYSYCCVRCGPSPPVLIADTDCKVLFDVPGDHFKRPYRNHVKPEDTAVNMRDRWQTLEKRMVAAGLCDGAKVANPYTCPVTYSSFTPWLGEEVRVSDVVPKTEVLKGLFQKGQSPSSEIVFETDEEAAILKVLESNSPKRSDLVKACNGLGVPLSGSISDLMHRLKELLLYKELHPNMFVKLQKAGGGIFYLTCIHSVVYYHSPLWWPESARDHGDALLSFKHPPTVVISDIAGRVAKHVNDRTDLRFFQPNDGCLCDDSEENVQAAKEKWLKARLPWVTGAGVTPQATCADTFPCSDRYSTPHPVTGTDARFSLYPHLHQRNPKHPEELLRNLELAPDLAALVNSSMTEPLSRELCFSRHHFGHMEEDHYKFSLRLYFHLHNLTLNKRHTNALQQQTQTPRHISDDAEEGQATGMDSG
ncbi:uncharacterized protein LOC121708549 isoform X1 [Alosa sapidissima]|uniref:uncharacterized protein LOC121708549 isoform X1 n=1 Tax=Alosa sapidissima TaxID=34773 RepID=UPI001C0A12FB|nr:uncharacterized protein LOC121708549 isoform X1 [Alosa sapidissima]XP_041947213.1 uncharacterized protein LOC121708549 isoform X1 [Alosa sapidissima]